MMEKYINKKIDELLERDVYYIDIYDLLIQDKEILKWRSEGQYGVNYKILEDLIVNKIVEDSTK